LTIGGSFAELRALGEPAPGQMNAAESLAIFGKDSFTTESGKTAEGRLGACCEDSYDIASANTGMKTLIQTLCVGFATVILSARAVADALVLKTGQVVKGEILQNDEKGVLLRMDYGTFTYPKLQIKEIHEEPRETNLEQVVSISPSSRIPRWGDVLLHLTKQPWARDIKQIPATFIDTGVLKNVPYISFRCAYTYELNVYGDPDSPAGIEIGLYRAQLINDAGKTNCIEFIAGILRAAEDTEPLRKLTLEKDVFTRNASTTEITPQSDPDAYGGWWVSIYDEAKLNSARASDAEIRQITVPRNIASAPVSVKHPSEQWSKADLNESRPASATSYTPTFSAPAASPSYDPSSSGSVYVRGYFRKDGTYVHPHTRSAPRR